MATILAEPHPFATDPAARGELIRRHLPLVRAIARRFAHRGEELDDLVQVGSIGLIAAVDRFRPERGDFAAYAVPTIAGEIRRHLRDRASIVRLPRRLHELRVRLPGLQRELVAELGRAPTTEELARKAEASAEDVLRLLDREPRTAPLPEERLDGDDPYPWAEDRVFVVEALRTLEPRERAILHLRFFEGLSQAEIGERLGISQIHVSRLLRSALEELRTGLGDPP